jgi:hypothetical protein
LSQLPGALDDVDTAVIAAFAAERLAKYKLPATYDVVEQLPRAAHGKLKKRKLRDPHWENASGGWSGFLRDAECLALRCCFVFWLGVCTTLCQARRDALFDAAYLLVWTTLCLTPRSSAAENSNSRWVRSDSCSRGGVGHTTGHRKS